MLERTGKAWTFTETYNRALSGNYDGEHVRAAVKEAVRQLYGPAPLASGARWDEGLARLLEKQSPKLVKEAMIDLYGVDVAKATLRHVKTRNPGLQDPGLQELRGRVPNFITDLVKAELADNWKVARGDAPYHWIDRGHMQFDEEAGTLVLWRGGDGRPDRDDNMRELAKFIRGHLRAKPEEPEFQNIANNILSYLPRGISPVEDLRMRAVARGAAHMDADAALSTVTLTVSGDPDRFDVGVTENTSIPYKNIDRGDVGPVDYSKYRYIRREAFEISGENLRSVPMDFEPEANLRSAYRFDTIDSR
jgi:hypothetical protein